MPSCVGCGPGATVSGRAVVISAPKKNGLQGQNRETRAVNQLLAEAEPGVIGDAYTFSRTLGTGAYALVKAATHIETGTRVAVKIVKLSQEIAEAAGVSRRLSSPNGSRSRSAKSSQGQLARVSEELYETGPPTRPDLSFEEVLNEIEVLRTLDSVNVLHVLGHYMSRTCDKVYIVTELLDGGELLDAVLERGSFSEADARVVFRSVLQGLVYMHERGVIHRDVKLENLLLADKRDLTSVHFVDFGLARAVSRGFVSQLEESGDVVVGTPSYAAPEIVLYKQYGPPSDCWSAGVVLYILLSGVHPFDQERNREVLFRRIVHGDYSMSRSEIARVSREAKELIQDLLDLDPAYRIDAAAALKHPWTEKADTDEDRIDLSSRSRLRQQASSMDSKVCTFQPGEYLVKAGRPTDKIFLIKAGVCEKIREIDPLDGGWGLPLRPATPGPGTPVRANGNGNGYYANGIGNGNGGHSGVSGRHSVGYGGGMQSGRQANLEALGTMTAGELVWGQASGFSGVPRQDEGISIRAVTQVKAADLPNDRVRFILERDPELQREADLSRQQSLSKAPIVLAGAGQVLKQDEPWHVQFFGFWNAAAKAVQRETEQIGKNLQTIVSVATCGLASRPLTE